MSVIGPVQSHYYEGSTVGKESLRWGRICWKSRLEFYLYPTVSTALIYLLKPESNKWDQIECGVRSNWVILGVYGNH